jgi:hypothetical protein
MAHFEIDPEMSAYTGLTVLEESEDTSDALEKFFESAPLAGFVTWQGVAAIAGETSELHKRARIALTHATAAPRVEESDRLEKSFGPKYRAKMYVAEWLRGELALGKTVSELAEYAERHDADTARLIREIGEEITA